MLGIRNFQRSIPALRQLGARRLASTSEGFSGAADNAFNRERAAVKAHAAATSGTSSNYPDAFIGSIGHVGKREDHAMRSNNFYRKKNMYGKLERERALSMVMLLHMCRFRKLTQARVA